MQYDILILGSGPAGLTAAIYAARADLKVLIIGGNPPGGQLTMTTDVENFPGFEEGIMGPELIERMRSQALRFGAAIVDENVLTLEGNVKDKFLAHTENGNTYTGNTVIVATGASARWLNLPNEQRLRGKGVSACATCDGFFFKGKDIAVVGGGDSAMEEATFLTKFANKVYVLVRGGQAQMRASKIMQSRAMGNPKIEFLFNTEVIDVLGDDSVTGLKLKNSVDDSEQTLDVQGLFLAIGHTPNTGFLSGVINTDNLGYATAQENTKSSVEGIFVAGDVYDHRYRQAITAAGYGCMAALDAQRYIQEHLQA